MIPADFDEWKDCIQNRCGIHLTDEYIQKRIAALSNSTDTHTIQFVKFYGRDYTLKVIAWFEQALVKY